MPIFELPILDAGVKPFYNIYRKEFIEYAGYDKSIHASIRWEATWALPYTP